jgi:AraC-like DNA-binding protein
MRPGLAWEHLLGDDVRYTRLAMFRVATPAAGLQHLVRHYVHVEAHWPMQTIVQPVPARTAQAIEFTFGDRFNVWVAGASHPETAHVIAVIGAQTYRRVHLAMAGRIETFVIVFQPGGFSQLFSVAADDLTDQHFDGRAVLDASVGTLWCQLGESRSFTERTRVTDAYLLRRPAARRSYTDVTAAARALRGGRGVLRVSDMATRAGISVRQFERRFVSQMGMAPKLYARVARFEAALTIKAQWPDWRWTDVAHELGYHDQAHMVHDFHLLSGSTPSAVAPQMEMYVAAEIGP